MDFLFDKRISTLEKEHDDIINTASLITKKVYILKVISTVGIKKTPKDLNKPLRGFGKNVYQMTIQNKRIIYLYVDNAKSVYVCSYTKKTNKMPKNIEKRIINRLKILNKEL